MLWGCKLSKAPATDKIDKKKTHHLSNYFLLLLCGMCAMFNTISILESDKMVFLAKLSLLVTSDLKITQISLQRGYLSMTNLLVNW